MPSRLVILYVVFFLVLLSGMGGIVWCEELDTSFKTKSGSVIGWKSDTDWAADYPLASTATYYLTPGQGSALAHAIILQGTMETHFYAKKITYSLGTENFLLEGEGQIKQGDNELFGPDRIDFNSEKNLMILYGKPNAPAKIKYIRDNNSPMKSDALRIDLYFEQSGGEKTLKRIEVKGNQETQIHLGSSSSNASKSLGQTKSATQKTPPKKMSKPN